MKKVLLAASVLSAATLFVIVLTSAIKKQNQLVCRNIQVKIDYDAGLAFLTEAEIKNKINYMCGGNIAGKPLSGIDFSTLEKTHTLVYDYKYVWTKWVRNTYSGDQR